MEHKLDFEVYSKGNPEVLILIDTSEVYTYPSNQLVEVSFPNTEDVFKDYYNVDKPTVLTTKSLGFSPNRIDFPDGLYRIRISVAPNAKVFKCKFYLKVDKAIKKLAALVEETTTKEEVLRLMEIDKLLVAAQITALEDEEKSIELYNLANKKLNSLNCYS